MRLSDPQSHFLLILAGKNPVRHRESDGSFMPRAMEKRTVEALENKGLLRWVHVGKDGFKFNGVVLTDAGRSALSANGHL